MSERLAGALGTVALPSLFVWYRDEDWIVVSGALFVAGLIGLAGGGIYQYCAERNRPRRDLTGWFLSTSGTVAVALALAVRATGQWRGVPSILEAAVGGGALGVWLLFVRIMIGGLPRASSRP